MRAIPPAGRVWARRAVALSAGLVLAGAATGCGQGSGTQLSTNGKPVPVAVLTAAATSTGSQHTAQMTMTESLSASLLPHPVTVHGTGAVNLDTKSVEINLDMADLASMGSSALGDGHMVEILAGGQVYLSGGLVSSELPAGKSWLVVGDPSKLTGTSSVASVPQATSELTMLQQLGGNVTRVGTEQIGGEPTTHYRADIDLAKIAAKLPAGLPADLKSTFAAVGDGGRLPTDVWVGADGLVHQVSMQMTMGSLLGRKIDMSMSVTETFDHFGEPVDIAAPPPDQVAPFSGLTGLPH